MPTTIHKEQIGNTSDGKAIHAFSLDNSNGLRATFIDFGCTLIELEVPDRKGIPNDITLGFDSIEEYIEANNPFFGTVVGRYANRINNGEFTLDGNTYKLPINEEELNNHLHGGPEGFAKKVFDAEIIQDEEDEKLQLSLESPDGDMGYPGNLKLTITISLTEDNGLHFDYSAVTDAPTVINMTTHPYFNLISNDDGSIRGHHIQVMADRFIPVDENSIPTGKIESVTDTPFDFREMLDLDPRLDSANPQIDGNEGFDHTFVFDEGRDLSSPVMIMTEETTGRKLEIFTSEPGIQIYTANKFDGSLAGKNGFRYQKHCAIALETQHFADSPNQPDFPSTVLRPGETFHSWTEYRFSSFG